MRPPRAATFATVLAAFTAACATPGPAAGAAASPAPAPRTTTVFFGTYTNDGASQGIYRATLDLATGALTPAALAATARNPSFLALAPGGRFLYAVGEYGDPAKDEPGSVSAYAIDEAGELTLLNQVSSRGAWPCHVSLTPSGRHALVANYGSGSVAAFPVAEDGRLVDRPGVARHAGSGPNRERQEAPHAHSIFADATGRRVYAADLGIDRVVIYTLDEASGALAAGPAEPGRVAPGAGPRHLAFHPSGRWAFVNNELTSTATSFAVDAASGALTEVQTVTTLPAEFSGRNSTAQILTSPDGRWVYVSNRGHDSIAIFAVDAASGRLTPVGIEPTGGRTPRNFNIEPGGRLLLAANQRSNNVVVFRIDAATGRLAATGATIDVPQPVSVVFLPR